MKIFLPVALLFPIALSACASSPSFEADAALLVSWTQERQDAMPAPPYAARYRKRGRRLTFVASRHEHRTGCATFAVVQREFERLAPEVVILEGFATDSGPSPEGYVKFVQGQPAGELWPGGEAAFAAKLALEAGIPFVGGEPTDDQIFAQAQTDGIGPADLIYYFVLRQVPQWKRAEQDRDQSFAQLYDDLIRQLARIHRINQASYADPQGFKDWYQRRNGRPFVYDEITTEQSAPLSGPDVLFSQKVSSRVSDLRDTHIVGVIADLLNQHERVLIVYGAGHHVAQKLALSEMLGMPTLSK